MINLFETVVEQVLSHSENGKGHFKALKDIQKQLKVSDEQFESILNKFGKSSESIKNEHSRTENKIQYFRVLKYVLDHGLLKPGERGEQEEKMLQNFRMEHSLTDRDHIDCLTQYGWTEEEYYLVKTGKSRDILKEYSKLILKINENQSPTIEDYKEIENFRKIHGITPVETDEVFTELEITEDQFDAHQIGVLRQITLSIKEKKEEDQKEILRLESQIFKMNEKEIEIIGNIQELSKKYGINEEKSIELEKELRIVRNKITEIESYLSASRAALEQKELLIKETKSTLEHIEQLLQEKTKDSEELHQKIVTFNNKIVSANASIQKSTGEIENNNESVKSVGRQDWGMNVHVPLISETNISEAEQKKFRLFRTICLAISASLLNESDVNVHVDIGQLFEEVKQKNIQVENWRNYVTQRIKELKEKKIPTKIDT